MSDEIVPHNLSATQCYTNLSLQVLYRRYIEFPFCLEKLLLLTTRKVTVLGLSPRHVDYYMLTNNCVKCFSFANPQVANKVW